MNFLAPIQRFFSLLQNLAQLKPLIARSQVELLMQTDRFQKSHRLAKYGYSIFSQSDEDGIIAEICRRLKLKSGFFVEFGVENGQECNTLALLTQGWQGVWIEPAAQHLANIKTTFAQEIAHHQLKINSSFITAENINQVFQACQVPKQFDLLSIDIDGVDFWVWQALTKYQPKVVVVEYNAHWGANYAWSVPYSPNFTWDRKSWYFGASLKALEILGKQKGYTLVGVNLFGTNAFFVKTSLLKNLFPGPHTTAYHWEPPRYMFQTRPGNPKKMAPLIKIDH